MTRLDAYCNFTEAEILAKYNASELEECTLYVAKDTGDLYFVKMDGTIRKLLSQPI